MNKTKSFIQLDFITVKPYFTIKNISIYALLAFFLVVFSGNASTSIGIGMMLGTMFVSYPFAAGEKCDMDALYAVLSVNRKTVVLGRYLFALLVTCLAILFSCVLAVTGLLVTQNAGFNITRNDIPGTLSALAVLFTVIQAIQLPIYFKLGYSKARFITLAPYAVIALFVSAMVLLTRDNEANRVISSNVFNFIASINGNILIASAVIIFLAILFGSYKLSLFHYRKREF